MSFEITKHEVAKDSLEPAQPGVQTGSESVEITIAEEIALDALSKLPSLPQQPLDPKDIATLQQQLEEGIQHVAKALETYPEPSKKRLALVSFLTFALTLTESFLNRATNNTDFGSKVNSTGWPLMINMVSANAIGKMLKPIWKNAKSEEAQIAILAVFAVMTVTCDAISYGMSSNKNPEFITQATPIAGTIMFGYLAKMVAYKLMGLASYRTAEHEQFTRPGSDVALRRKRASYVVIGTMSAISAVFNQLMSNASGGLSVVGNLAFSQGFGKTGKSALKILDTRGDKTKTLLAYWAIAGATSAVVGACFPLDTEDAGGFELLSKIAYHYAGPTLAIASSVIFTNLIFRTCEKNKKAQVEEVVEEPQAIAQVHEKKPPSKVKKIIHALAFTGTTIASAAVYAWNNISLKSKVAGLMAKMCQAGWGFHSGREVLKGIKNGAFDAAILGTGLAVAAATEYVAYQLDPTREQTGFFDSMQALPVAAGTIACLAAKKLRDRIIPKE